MSKLINDGHQRYAAANANQLSEIYEVRRQRIERHYKQRMLRATILRRMMLRMMRQKHLACLKSEIYGDQAFYAVGA